MDKFLNVNLTGRSAYVVERLSRQEGWSPAEALAFVLEQAEQLLDAGLLTPSDAVEEGYDAKVDPDLLGVDVLTQSLF